MGRLSDLLKGRTGFKSPELIDKEKEKTYTSQSDLLKKAVKDTPIQHYRTTGNYTPTTPKTTRLSELLKSDTKYNPRQQFAKYGSEQKQSDTTYNPRQQFSRYNFEQKQIERAEAEAKEATRKETLSGAKERLDYLLDEAKAIEQSPEPDATKQTALTEDILKTRNLITANQPGFTSGLRSVIGLDPTAKFSAQQATEERQQASDIALQQAQEQKGYTTGKVVGELGKQALLYATIGKALEGTALGAKLASKLGGGKAGKFASKQVVDLLIDTVIQTPQEIMRDESLGQIGINRLVDIGINLVVGGSIDGISYLNSIAKSNPDAVKQGILKSDIPNKQNVMDRLGLERADDIIKQADETADAVKGVDDVDTSYRIGHQITFEPEEVSSLDNVLKTKSGDDLLPNDFFDHPEWYANMDDSSYKESFEIIKKMQGDPNKTVTIYRGVPNNVDNINSGDWISLSKEYALGEAIENDAKVISKEVKASDVIWDGNDINEFTFIPKQDQIVKSQKAIPKIEKPKIESVETEFIKPEIAVKPDTYNSGSYKTVDDNTWISFKTEPSAAIKTKLDSTNWEMVSPTIYKREANKITEASARTILKRADTINQPKKLSQMLKEDAVKPKTMASEIENVKTSVPEQVDLTMPAKIEDSFDEKIKFKERGFSENVRTDKAMKPEINAEFDKNPLFYEELSNMTTLERAQARFDRGFDEALKDFEATKGELKADNVVLARMLANEAVKNGDMATARRVLSDIAETLTTSGQYSQAARILRESNDPATILAYIEKELKKLNDQGVKRYGVEKPTTLSKLTGSDKTKGWKEIKLTDDELAKISRFTSDTTDAEKQVLFEELFDSISTRIPTSLREKIDAWRRISMLFNPKTHIRNVVGNSIMTGVKKASDTLAAAGEKFLPKLDRTKTVIKSKASKKIAEDYFNANKSDLLEGSRWEIFGVKSPFADKKIFDNKYLEALNTVSKNTLEAEDVVFMKRHFIDDLAGFLDARGLKEPTQEAVDYALKRAQEATFRQQNALADIISKGKKSRYGLLVEAAVPFSKTPANIAQMGIDYSPIGVVNSIYKLATNQPPAEFIETLSKGLTGTGLAFLGATMASNGMARGSYKTDKSEEALLTKAGQLPNSISLPTGSYTIDWAQPAAIPFFMGVAFQEELENKDTDIVDAFYNAGVKGVDTIFEQTMLSGIKDIFGGYGSTTEKISELPFDYLMQGLPTVAGQVARTVDPVKRMRDYSGLVPKLQTQTKAKTPLKSKELPAKRGMFGEELTYGSGVTNALQQFLSPGYYAKNQDDSLTNEMLRLYNEVGGNFLPRVGVKKLTKNRKTYNLTTQEQSDFQKIMGEYTKQGLEKLLNEVWYKNLTDEEKAKAIRKVNDEGYDLAKEKFFEGVE